MIRSVEMYPSSVAYVYDTLAVTWGQVHKRAMKYASALKRLKVGKNDVVSLMAANTPLAFESHFGVIGANAVLHTINVRLDKVQIAFQLQHARTKVLLVDGDFLNLAKTAVELIPDKAARPIVICAEEHSGDSNTHNYPSWCLSNYESFLSSGSDVEELSMPDDEWDACCVNYTSGTTGDPKGVVYHHRGAYLNAMSNLIDYGIRLHDSFLWGNNNNITNSNANNASILTPLTLLFLL